MFDLFSEYFTFHKEKRELMKKNQESQEENLMKTENKNLQEFTEIQKEEKFQYTDRALLLLSFKGTPTQNLQHVLDALEINTIEQKKNILLEIFRLIREGIVYIPKGLPDLIEYGIEAEKIQMIDLCLLRPYDQIIQLINSEILNLKNKTED